MRIRYNVAYIKRNTAKNTYYYVVAGRNQVTYFTSVEYTSIDECKRDFALMQSKVKKFGDKCISIHRLQKGITFYFTVNKTEKIKFGSSPVYTQIRHIKYFVEAFIDIMKGKVILINKNDMQEDNVVLNPIDPRVISYMFSLDGVGFDNNGKELKENPTQVKQWEHPHSPFWSDNNVRENFLKAVLKLEEPKSEIPRPRPSRPVNKPIKKPATSIGRKPLSEIRKKVGDGNEE